MDLVMYVVINSDLKMREGRTAVQIGHIVHTITDAIVRDSYETTPMPEYCIRYLKWCQIPTMRFLRATESELHELLKLPETCPFHDDIDNHKELTGIGIFPGPPRDFSQFKLL